MKKIKIPKNVSDKLNDLADKLKNADQKTVYYIFGGILLGVFLLDYFLIMRPQINTLTKLTPEIKEMQGNIERTSTNFLRLDEYKNQIKDMKEKVYALDQGIVPKEGIPLLLEVVSRIALENRIKINQIMPRTDEIEEVLIQGDRRYLSLPILLEAKTGYHALGKFLNDLEASSTYFRPDMFIVSRTQGESLNSIRLTLNAIIYETVESE